MTPKIQRAIDSLQPIDTSTLDIPQHRVDYLTPEMWEAVGVRRSIIPLLSCNTKKTSKCFVTSVVQRAQSMWRRRIVVFISFTKRETATTASRWLALEKAEATTAFTAHSTARASETAELGLFFGGRDVTVTPDHVRLLGNTEVQLNCNETVHYYETRLNCSQHSLPTAEREALMKSLDHLCQGDRGEVNSTLYTQQMRLNTIPPEALPTDWRSYSMDRPNTAADNASLLQRYPLSTPLPPEQVETIRRVLSRFDSQCAMPWPCEFFADITSAVILRHWRSISPYIGPTQFDSVFNQDDPSVTPRNHIAWAIPRKFMPYTDNDWKHLVKKGWKPRLIEDIADEVVAEISQALHREVGEEMWLGVGPTAILAKMACNECVRRCLESSQNAQSSGLVESTAPADGSPTLRAGTDVIDAHIRRFGLLEDASITAKRKKIYEKWVVTNVGCQPGGPPGSAQWVSPFVRYKLSTAAAVAEFMSVVPVFQVPLLGPAQVKILEGRFSVLYCGDVSMEKKVELSRTLTWESAEYFHVLSSGLMKLPTEVLHLECPKSHFILSQFIGRVSPHVFFVAHVLKMGRALIKDIATCGCLIQQLALSVASTEAGNALVSELFLFPEPTADADAILSELVGLAMMPGFRSVQGVCDRYTTLYISRLTLRDINMRLLLCGKLMLQPLKRNPFRPVTQSRLPKCPKGLSDTTADSKELKALQLQGQRPQQDQERLLDAAAGSHDEKAVSNTSCDPGKELSHSPRKSPAGASTVIISL